MVVVLVVPCPLALRVWWSWHGVDVCGRWWLTELQGLGAAVRCWCRALAVAVLLVCPGGLGVGRGRGPPRRPSCHKRHGRPSSAMRSRASAPPTPPKPSASGSRPPTPRPGPPAPPPHPAPPATTTPGRGRTRARGGQGTPRGLRQEGTEGPQVKAGTHRDRAPEETPHGGRKPPKNQEGAGAGTKARRKRAPRQTPRPKPRKGIPRRGDQSRPTPTERPTTPGGAPPNTHRRSKHQTPYRSHQRTPTSHRKPHGEWRAHLHGENGPHPQRKPQGTPPRGAPPRPHRQETTPAATRATSQAPEEDEGTAAAARTRV